MNKITQQLERIQKEKRTGVMTHVVIGYPNLKGTEELVLGMEKAGVDFIEMQIPFSDPIADGTTIMRANDVSLANGTTFDDCLLLATKLSKKVSIPLLFMGYYNSVFSRGVERFCKESRSAGIEGLIIPDIPIDEEPYEQFVEIALKNNLNPIRVISPTTTDERLRLNVKSTTGFVYCTARTGTTGTTSNLEGKLSRYLKRVRKQLPVPLAVGFGISEPAHVRALKGAADIAVIGSALISSIETGGVKTAISLAKALTDAARR